MADTKKTPKTNAKFEEGFNLQSWLDLWSKESVDQFVENFVNFQNKATSLVRGKTKRYTEAYYAQKAIACQADPNLPFQTLVLLGEKLSHPAYKEEIEQIIKDNVIKFKGTFYKLTDLESQNKIQNAISNYEFEECSPLKKSA